LRDELVQDDGNGYQLVAKALAVKEKQEAAPLPFIDRILDDTAQVSARGHLLWEGWR
jgi:hypothetical protein